MSLLSARDTFATLLSTNLADYGIPFHWVMFSSSDPALSRLQVGAVNLYFMGDSSEGTLDVLQTSIDVVHQEERTAIYWMDILTNSILRKSGITKHYNYDTPSSPTEETGNIIWDIRGLNWTYVANDNYCHYNCTFDLIHIYPTLA